MIFSKRKTHTESEQKKNPFFDMSKEEQKKIVKKAAQRANEEQKYLVDRYNKCYNN